MPDGHCYEEQGRQTREASEGKMEWRREIIRMTVPILADELEALQRLHVLICR